MNRNVQKKYFERKHGSIPESLLVPFKFELNVHNEPSDPAEDNMESNMVQKDTKIESGDEMEIDLITRNFDEIKI